MSALPAFASVRGADLEIRVKAVPGARRDEIAGPLGDRLKIRVAQPPEGGKANDAIRTLLAERLDVVERAVVLVSGAANPAKTFVISGLAGTAGEACAKLA